jgi:hypothetical protein
MTSLLLALDKTSLLTICKGANQVMVYGSKQCKYEEIARSLRGMTKEETFPLKKVLTWCVANDGSDSTEKSTAEGRKMDVIPFDNPGFFPQSTSRPCKTALTDLVLENYKRKREGKALIPLLFCIDIDKNPYPLSAEEMLTKDRDLNNLIFHKEMRRAYKLCHDPKVDPKIRAIAQETFKFVKVTVDKDKTHAFQQVQAPWSSAKEPSKVSDEFAIELELRKEESVSRAKPAYACWRTQLARRAAAFDEEFEKAVTT